MTGATAEDRQWWAFSYVRCSPRAPVRPLVRLPATGSAGRAGPVGVVVQDVGMPVEVKVVTATLSEIVEASGLAWVEIATDRGERAPSAAGVYAWVSSLEGDRDAVLYLGRASNLRKRVGDELRWVEQANVCSAVERQTSWAGHPRMALRYRARLHYAITGEVGDQRDAKNAERELLHFCRFVTGTVPPVNGSGWWNRSAEHDAARERAWAAVQEADLVLNE